LRLGKHLLATLQGFLGSATFRYTGQLRPHETHRFQKVRLHFHRLGRKKLQNCHNFLVY
jgi:hypothetical protein